MLQRLLRLLADSELTSMLAAKLEPVLILGHLLAFATGYMLPPWQVFVCSFILAAGSGFAAELHKPKVSSLRKLAASTLYSGLLGLIVALLWHNYFEGKNLYALIGCSGAVGFGGVSVVELLLAYFQGGGISISIAPKSPEHDVSAIDDGGKGGATDAGSNDKPDRVPPPHGS